MTRIHRYKFLGIFGDGKSHSWFEVVNLGVRHLRVHQTDFEKIFRTAIEYSWIRRDGRACHFQDDTFSILPLGDQCLREEQIARAGDPSYYKYFDRSIDGANGLNKYAPIQNGYKSYG